MIQALCRFCDSHVSAVQFLSSFLLKQIVAHCSEHLYHTPVSHCQIMRASRSFASLLLHACDAVDSTHPLHTIASDTVEALAAHASQQVMAASSLPQSSLSCALFVAAAVASRAGAHEGAIFELMSLLAEKWRFKISKFPQDIS